MFKNYISITIIIFFISSCQPIETIDSKVFDYNQFNNINIVSKEKIINQIYEPIYDKVYIDNALENEPNDYLKKWLSKNIDIKGNQNVLEINIINSSLKKTEIKNKELKKYKEKEIFLFEITYLVEFILYDNNNLILASVIVEANRSITSGKYISILESEKIIEHLIFNCLKDFSIKAQDLINIHLKDYII